MGMGLKWSKIEKAPRFGGAPFVLFVEIADRLFGGD